MNFKSFRYQEQLATYAMYVHTTTAFMVKCIKNPNVGGVCILADSGFFLDFYYQSGVKSTVSGVFNDLKFKISEGYKQN